MIATTIMSSINVKPCCEDPFTAGHPEVGLVKTDRARRMPSRKVPIAAQALTIIVSVWRFLVVEFTLPSIAGVAQSVEQLIRNEKVGCSIHLSGTK